MFNIEELNKKVQDFKDRSLSLGEDVVKFLSSLKLKFKDGLNVMFVDPSCDYGDYKDEVTIYAMDSEGIWFDEDCEDDGIEYSDMCLDDLIELAEEVIKSPEFKKKYLK